MAIKQALTRENKAIKTKTQKCTYGGSFYVELSARRLYNHSIAQADRSRIGSGIWALMPSNREQRNHWKKWANLYCLPCSTCSYLLLVFMALWKPQASLQVKFLIANIRLQSNYLRMFISFDFKYPSFFLNEPIIYMTVFFLNFLYTNIN